MNLFSHVGVLSCQAYWRKYRLLHIKKIRTTPYHPQTDGVVERFNGTLKSILRKFVSRSQKDWDEYLPYLLFAYREVPQETTGFSPPIWQTCQGSAGCSERGVDGKQRFCSSCGYLCDRDARAACRDVTACG